jgi:ribonuclease D
MVSGDSLAGCSSVAEQTLIQTPEEFEELARALRGEPILAVDTEADSFFHYYDKLCLLQLGTRTDVYLIDPLALPPESALDPLKPILADTRVRKIFHAAEYDLYVLQRCGGAKVRNIFDTMISAQLLGYPAVGLGALVEHHFQIQLSKDQQRTDWSRRPLRPAQVDYAASDVRYLVELAERLEKELREKKRLSWAQAEFKALEARVWPEREFDPEGYLRIKGARLLPADGLAVLRELYLMRDRRARHLDRPPFKVLGNGTLLDLAQRPARSKRGLVGRRGVSDLVIRRLGNDIVDAVKKGLDGPAHPPLERKPSGTGRRRMDRRGDAHLARLKKWRADRSKELGIDPGVFCPNAALEEIALASPSTLEELQSLRHPKPWWTKAFGRDVMTCLKEATAAADATNGASKPQASGGAEASRSSNTKSRRRRARRRRGRKRGRGQSEAKPK